MRNFLLYTTNENWQAVNLKEARDFSGNKKFIYVFKKLEWESLFVDILPHPDMFSDAYMMSPENGRAERDTDGAKRLFFGGERFLEGISGYAHITVQRTEYNNPLGLDVRLHITEAVCPSLSEPGLRALLRFMTGFYVCLNRGDIDHKKPKNNAEAAGRSIVALLVDHIFVCIKDSEFQLELLVQSLYFSRASISNGENTKHLSRIMIGGLFLRDSFSHPPCTLIQPSMESDLKYRPQVPKFVDNFCPPIYPLGVGVDFPDSSSVPLICIHSLQTSPPLNPPSFASETIIECLPLMITLQEESCLRIASFLADGIVISPGAVLPDSSINSIIFMLRQFDLIVPLNGRESFNIVDSRSFPIQSFSGARLHVESFVFSQSPLLNCELLNIESDPSCFALWPGQPIDSSHRKWKTQVSHLSISLETLSCSKSQKISSGDSSGLWTCVELEKLCFEVAMVTPDGSPLVHVPPPGGIVRIGVACQQYLSNASVDQLFFILDLYTYFGDVSERIMKISKSRKQRSKSESSLEKLLEKVPSDTAVSLVVSDLQLKFLDTSSIDFQGEPLVKFTGEDLFIKVSHRTLGGAFAVSTNLNWGNVRVECVDTKEVPFGQNQNEYPQMRSVFWINEDRRKVNMKAIPFLAVNAVHVIPYCVKDAECHSLNVSAKVSAVRLGGGMSYTEVLLHRFGILGMDGGPGEGLRKGFERLSSGPLAKLLRASPLADSGRPRADHANDEITVRFMELGKPDDIDIALEMNDWLFALQGLREGGRDPLTYLYEGAERPERCWHGTFQSFKVSAKSTSNDAKNLRRINKYPVQSLTVSMEGLKALKPQWSDAPADPLIPLIKRGTSPSGGLNLAVNLAMSEDDDEEMSRWNVESLNFSVKEPVDVVVTRDEVEQLVALCGEEVDSVGRITAGVLKLLKLDESIGQATIDQLSNLGRESVDRIFSPERMGRRSSLSRGSYDPFPSPVGSTGRTPTLTLTLNPSTIAGPSVTSLETLLSDSQAKCSSLVAELAGQESSPQLLAEMKQLLKNMETIQELMKLKS
ncbi:amino-terminal region of chorein isoform X2 [Wolffia australiana]